MKKFDISQLKKNLAVFKTNLKENQKMKILIIYLIVFIYIITLKFITVYINPNHFQTKQKLIISQ